MFAKIWIPLLTGLLGGVVGGIGVWLIMSYKSSQGPQIAASAEASRASRPGSASASEDLEARIQKLERRGAAAQALGEYAKAVANRTADGGPGSQPQLINPENPVFELAVRGVVEKLEWEKGEEQRVERDNRRLERAEQITTHLAQKLSLNPNQRSQVSQVVVESMNAFRELRNPTDGSSGPSSRSEWRARTGKIRETTDAKLAQILNPAQLGTYRDLLENDEALRWWGRMGRSEGRVGR
jgi:hypothetical protein